MCSSPPRADELQIVINSGWPSVIARSSSSSTDRCKHGTNVIALLLARRPQRERWPPSRTARTRSALRSGRPRRPPLRAPAPADDAPIKTRHGGPAEGTRSPAYPTHQPWRHLDLPARDRQRRAHRHRLRSKGTDDPRQYRTPRPVHGRSPSPQHCSRRGAALGGGRPARPPWVFRSWSRHLAARGRSRQRSCLARARAGTKRLL